jgi:Recombination endonuclease VII
MAHKNPEDRRRYNRERYAVKGKEIYKKQRQWAHANPEKVRLSAYKYKLKVLYGMTWDDWQRLFESQGSCCAICKETNPHGGWALDHNHQTNQVRAVLCLSCNTTLGHMKENPALLRAAAAYLEKHAGDTCQSLSESCRAIN